MSVPQYPLLSLAVTLHVILEDSTQTAFVADTVGAVLSILIAIHHVDTQFPTLSHTFRDTVLFLSLFRDSV